MKRLFLLLILLGIYGFAFSQDKPEKSRRIPSVTVKNIHREPFRTDSISNNGNPIILSFWATWCVNCVKELNKIQPLYDDWKDETGVKLIAVSIDDSRYTSRVLPFVNGRAWDYEILLDDTWDLKRALNVGDDIPYTFLIDGKGNIVYTHKGFADGDEYVYYDLIKKIKAGEDVSKSK
ncbi:MAG TPA: TlpA disulfide reductase family protein [Bacteroidales bacterium]|nr:TlpA disulfide reductase family protein [Bacteroidales bacterium]